jgi:hypothetical protein
MRDEIVFLLLVGALCSGGCESAADRCEAARSEADRAWGAYVDAATQPARDAARALETKTDVVARALLDLRSRRVPRPNATEAQQRAYVGIEVSVGAIVAAVLAASFLFPADAEAARRVTDAVTEELGGRYAELMTATLDDDETCARIHDLGDACATRLQLLIREQPEPVRARVLRAYESLGNEERAAEDDLTIEAVRQRFAELVEAGDAAHEAQARVDAAVTAREGVRSDSAAARSAALAVPEDPAPSRAAAVAASEHAFVTCSEAGL